MPAISSERSGEASISAGIGRTGRRFAYSPRPLRSPSSPCSGRGASGSVRIPLRAADGAEQHGVGAPAGVEHLVGERRAVLVDRAAADQVLAELAAAEDLEQLAGRGDDLGADPVAGEQDYMGGPFESLMRRAAV